MPFDTNVANPSPAALDLRPPPIIDPMEQIMKYRAQQLQQRLGAQQLQVGEQEQQSNALKLQEQQMNLEQRRAINEAYKGALVPQTDGTVALDKDKLFQAVATSGHGEALPAIQESYTKYQKSLSDLKETNQKVAAAESDHAGNIGAMVKAAGNDPAMLHTLFQDGISHGLLTPAHYAPLDKMLGDAIQQDPTGEQAKVVAGKIADQMMAGSPKQVQLGTEKTKAEGEAAKNKAEAGKLDLDKQLTQNKIDLYKALTAAPQALKTRIDASIDPAKYPDENARALNEAQLSPDLEGIDKVIARHSENVSQREKTIATETDPRVIAARVNQAKQEAIATAPTKIATSIAEAKAIRAGDNPAVAGVAPASVAKVQSDAIKLDNDALTAKRATETLGKILDLYDKGNKAAGANLPLVGVETLNAINGIKRINGAEISQYGTAGSLLDRIQGKIGSLAVGKPIPQDVVNDIRELHQQIAEGSYQQYTAGLNSLNQRTGSKFVPTVDAPNIRKPAAGASAYKAGDKRTINGKTVTRDAQGNWK
jgi:hypothetical protein